MERLKPLGGKGGSMGFSFSITSCMGKNSPYIKCATMPYQLGRLSVLISMLFLISQLYEKFLAVDLITNDGLHQ